MYEDWWERFYPQDIKPEQRLEYYAKYFDTVELNASFYHLPRRKTFENWGKKTPDRFVFSAKISKYITQNLKLKNADAPTELFLKESTGLGKKLGVILVQLPPNLHGNLERLESFLSTVDGLQTTEKSLQPADYRPQKRADKAVDSSQLAVVRFAFEFRHESWLNDEIYGLLRQYKAGFVIQDSVHWPAAEVVTSDFVYLRFHGPGALYSSNYPDSQLKTWAEKIKKWLEEGLDVYGYFNNDVNAYAVGNALKLKGLVSKS